MSPPPQDKTKLYAYEIPDHRIMISNSAKAGKSGAEGTMHMVIPLVIRGSGSGDTLGTRLMTPVRDYSHVTNLVWCSTVVSLFRVPFLCLACDHCLFYCIRFIQKVQHFY